MARNGRPRASFWLPEEKGTAILFNSTAAPPIAAVVTIPDKRIMTDIVKPIIKSLNIASDVSWFSIKVLDLDQDNQVAIVEIIIVRR